MSQDVASARIGSVDAEFEEVGVGLNVYESPEVVEGRVKWLGSPDDVIDFVQNEDNLADTVVVVRGGTTTFLTLALNAGIRGVITLQGAPESHLGILCREYGIPCVMSVAFDKGVRTERGETIPADGVRVRLDVSSRPQGRVSVEAGAPVDDSPAPEGPAGMTPEQLAQIQLLLEKFGGVVPHGPEGDAQMRAELTTEVLQLDDESVRRELTIAEANELVKYLTWNEWDALAARATEGESGLIPRQEYEAMGILNSWFKHPEWMRVVSDKVGADGLVEIGRKAQNEIGTKVNLLHCWAVAAATSFGRGIALEMKLHGEDHESDKIVQGLGMARRLYHGLWGGGAMFSSMRSYAAPVLDPSWIDRFTADRVGLADDEARGAFQRFNGSTELLGFLLHFDNRLGLGDSGPYPLPNGGFVIVRDLFINEPAFPWSDVTAELPYAVTQAMFFKPDSGIDVTLTDLSTMFTNPANYLPHIEGVAVYTREKFDTPMSVLKTLSLADMAELRTQCEEVSVALYKRIASMTHKEKVLAGATVYTAGFVLPFVRAAGVYDALVEEHGFFELHPEAEAAYEGIVNGGVATEMIPRLFLTGSWGVPLREPVEPNPDVSDEQRFKVLHALKLRGIASPEAVAESSGLAPSDVDIVLADLVGLGQAKQREGRIAGFTLQQAGTTQHAALLDRFVPTDGHVDALSKVYEIFLPINRAFKQLCTDWQLRPTGGADGSTVQNDHSDVAYDAGIVERLGSIHKAVSANLADAAAVCGRFGTYPSRLESKLAQVRSGDKDSLAKPLADSYHDIWMELHQDLLLSLRRERTEADE